MFSKNALVVDDSLTARTVLKHQLNQFDVVVESASDGSHALELLRSHTPDVIFLDHIMPGLDGFQVLQRLKKNDSTKSIPVVMYTSQAAPQYTIEAKSLGAIAVIPKKVTDEQLMEALDKAELYQLMEVNTEQAAIADAGAELTEALNKAEIHPFRAANADRALADDADDVLADKPRNPPGTRFSAERPGAQPGAVPEAMRSAINESCEVPATEPPPAPEKVEISAQPDNFQRIPAPPIRGWLIALAIGVLAFAQGYDIMRDRDAQQQAFNNLRQQVFQQQQTIQGLREQVSQQEKMLPEIQAQLVSEQRHLAESTWRQVEFLMTILMNQVQRESDPGESDL